MVVATQLVIYIGESCMRQAVVVLQYWWHSLVWLEQPSYERQVAGSTPAVTIFYIL